MDQLPHTLLMLTLLGYVAGALVGLVFLRAERLANYFAFGCAALGALGGVVASVWALAAGSVVAPSLQLLPSLIPYIKFTIRLDPLGLFFTLIVSLLGLALSIYSLGYARGFYGRKNVGVLGAFFNLLLLATTLVFLADNAFFFLLVWELMALTTYCLVSFEHEKEESRNAGVLYFVMSHIGTGCIMLGFLLLFQASGDYGFCRLPCARRRDVRRVAQRRVHPLPRRFRHQGRHHSAAYLAAGRASCCPSNVSAIMSGVLIKTGIYGLTRVFFDFLGTPPNWWGCHGAGDRHDLRGARRALRADGARPQTSACLPQHREHRHHPHGPRGGAHVPALGHPLLASLALIAGMYHTLNHAVFKGLLFLGAGAVLHATHTRNMEDMGGLAKRMPQTAFFFLVGAVAISALPPLNGFVSEWLTYQSLLQGFGTTPSLIRLMFP